MRARLTSLAPDNPLSLMEGQIILIPAGIPLVVDKVIIGAGGIAALGKVSRE